ncbi:proline racemase-2 [Coleophoma cylindrospora]|uniref:Proline racemase-2 n=1 Tax=Coleophoma cylindrospora TaxID=1849047 RepID=A0A3D8R147_9HELO|nr:proline racemase-2 [Coleophoma cylindrospora]
MHFARSISIVGAHAAGEVGDVIVGGVLDVPGKTMFEKMMYFWTKQDHLRNLLLNEPRGRSSMCTNLILPPCDPRADAGFLIMESDEYAPMSGSNTICTTTVLLETGMVEMKEPVTHLNLDTAAGLISVTALCEAGKCKSVSIDNVPAFVFALDLKVEVPGLGEVLVDVAWGGMTYAIVDAASVGLKIENAYGPKLVKVGMRIKRAVQEQFTPVHPENPGIKGVNILEFTHPLEDWQDGKTAVNTVVVAPGRFDRSPCGSGTCARMAVLHARGQLKVNEPLRHTSITGTEFFAHISGTTKVGDYPAVFPTVRGSAWITSFKQVVLDPSDPFPEGFRVGDQWHMAGQHQ